MDPQQNIPEYYNRKFCCQFHFSLERKRYHIAPLHTSLKYVVRYVVSVSSQIDEDMIFNDFNF